MDTDAALPDVALGKTGLRVTPLCIGCAPLGDMPDTFGYSVSDEDALETVRTAFDSPIRFLDTAASYGDGESERRIGKVINEIGGLPISYVLATKADRNLTSGDFGGPQMRRSVERSLFLLGLDRLQIVHLHDPEHGSFEDLTGPDGAIEALVRMKDEGMIGALGVAGGPIDLEIRYVELGVFDVVVTHNRYTLLNRTADPLIEMAAQRGVAVLNAAPYGSGILAKGPDAYARYAYQDAPAEIVERARRMQDACAQHGVPLAAAALQFSLRDPRITSTIVGMSKPDRIWQTLELARQRIPDELWPQLDAIGYEGSTEGHLDPERRRWQN